MPLRTQAQDGTVVDASVQRSPVALWPTC